MPRWWSLSSGSSQRKRSPDFYVTFHAKKSSKKTAQRIPLAPIFSSVDFLYDFPRTILWWFVQWLAIFLSMSEANSFVADKRLISFCVTFYIRSRESVALRTSRSRKNVRFKKRRTSRIFRRAEIHFRLDRRKISPIKRWYGVTAATLCISYQFKGELNGPSRIDLYPRVSCKRSAFPIVFFRTSRLPRLIYLTELKYLLQIIERRHCHVRLTAANVKG